MAYDETFYRDRDRATRQAAQAILPPLIAAVGAKRVADVGCGVGTWLAVALEAGAEEVFGFEGPWLDPAQLVVGRERVTLGDLERPLATGLRAEPFAGLAVCLEVAEHLSEARAPGLVADLARLADVVLFGAAIPGQGGVGHVNEQWQSWWAALFAAEGFMPFDAVRPAVWDDEAIPFWYRQNPLVYARPESAAAQALERLGGRPDTPLDLVHPALWRHRLDNPGVRESAGRLGRAARRFVRSRLP